MIITADLHLRYDVPRCVDLSLEGWFNHQKEVLYFIVSEANKRKSDVYVAGDIFHTAVVHSSIVSLFISAFSHLKGDVYCMFGNHDVLQRNPDLTRTSFGILQSIADGQDSNIKMMNEGLGDWIPYGTNTPPGGNSDILFVHESVWGSNATIPPGCDGITTKDILKKYPEHKLIVAGDTHTPILYEKDDRIVLVPGCITKQTADFKDKVLNIYEYDGEAITIIPLPAVDFLVDDKYLVEEKARDERLEAFVNSLKKTGGITLDFRDNVDVQLKKNGIKSETKAIIEELMEVNSGA